MADSGMRQAHIAVVGGGFTGMVCALRLLGQGYKVTVLEAAPEIGGLAGSFNFGDFRWDRFYHCILTSDKALLSLLDELDMSDELRWTATEVGLYSRGRLFKMSGPMDLLRFPHLGLVSKARLVLATLYVSHLTKGLHLEQVSLEAWTRKLFGDTVFEQIWEPLYRCKLGEMRRHASAAFLWGTLRRLYSTREKGPSKQERLGYVHGGYAAVFARLEQRVQALGAQIILSASVQRIAARPGLDSAEPGPVEVQTASGTYTFDSAIVTLPASALAKILDPDPEYEQQLKRVRYLGMVCVVLLLKRPLSAFYVTNITAKVPFTGVIEMTNLIDPQQETAGNHLVYLPRYTSPDDPLFDQTDDEVWQAFQPSLLSMYPDLQEAEIARRFVFRERAVQPVPTLDYSTYAPPVHSPVPGVYVVNTAQIINSTLNNNVMTTLATNACDMLAHDLAVSVPCATEEVCDVLYR